MPIATVNITESSWSWTNEKIDFIIFTNRSWQLLQIVPFGIIMDLYTHNIGMTSSIFVGDLRHSWFYSTNQLCNFYWPSGLKQKVKTFPVLAKKTMETWQLNRLSQYWMPRKKKNLHIYSMSLLDKRIGCVCHANHMQIFIYRIHSCLLLSGKVRGILRD